MYLSFPVLPHFFPAQKKGNEQMKLRRIVLTVFGFKEKEEKFVHI